MSGFEIVGLVGVLSATLDLLDRVIVVVKAYKDYDEDTQRLLTRLGLNKATMARYTQAFTALQSDNPDESVLSGEEQRLLISLSDDLSMVKSRLDMKLQQFVNTLKGKAGMLDRTKWAMWRKASFEDNQALLDDWAQRVGLMYASIEASLDTRRRSLPGPEHSADRMARLTSLYRGINHRGHTSEKAAYITFERLQLLGDPSRRMPAQMRELKSEHFVLPVLVEFMARSYSRNADAHEVSLFENATLELAKVLQFAEPRTTGLPRSPGYFHDQKTSRFGIVYEIPSNNTWYSDPQTGRDRALSLRELFNIKPRFPLDQRLRFCCDLAKAVLYVHFVGWVHKGIRPDNIIFLQPAGAPANTQFPYTLPSPLLAGFEFARSIDSLLHSDRTGDAFWRHNIYRHPNRQGLVGNEGYNMAHDVYSLGAVLLEIGMWGSKNFVPFQHATQQVHFDQVTAAERMARLLAIADGIPDEGGNRCPLAAAMGSRFDRLVRFCLNIDEQAALPTVAFVQKIWVELDEMRAALV